MAASPTRWSSTITPTTTTSTGFGLYDYPGADAYNNNVVRYNISQNDAQEERLRRVRVLECERRRRVEQHRHLQQHRLSFAAGFRQPRCVRMISTTNTVTIVNNIFITTNGLSLLDIVGGQTNMVIQGNDYYASGSAFVIKWAGTTYSSLAAFRSASGQESLDFVAVGSSANPLLTNPGRPALGNADLLNTLTAYKLQSNSAMINQGLTPPISSFVPAATQDFFGDALPQGGAYASHAHEFGGITTTADFQRQPRRLWPVGHVHRRDHQSRRNTHRLRSPSWTGRQSSAPARSTAWASPRS